MGQTPAFIGSDGRISCVCTCNSPYWNTRAKGKSEKKLLPLKFNGEEVLDSNFKRYTARKDIGTKIYR